MRIDKDGPFFCVKGNVIEEVSFREASFKRIHEIKK